MSFQCSVWRGMLHAMSEVIFSSALTWFLSCNLIVLGFHLVLETYDRSYLYLFQGI